MDKQQVFKFNVLSLGESTQQLGDSNQYINRPYIEVDDVRKKWGDEYVVVNSATGKIGDKPRMYLGSFCLDKKNRKYLKLFKELDLPIAKSDYYVINMSVSGDKVEKVADFVKDDEDSLSCVLSSAYDTCGEVTSTDMIIVCQHGDQIVINDKYFMFDRETRSFR